jgi:hypothetical protein
MATRGRPRKTQTQVPTEKWTQTYNVMGSKDAKGKFKDYKVVRNQDNQLKCNCLAFQCGRTKICKHIQNIKDHLHI